MNRAILKLTGVCLFLVLSALCAHSQSVVVETLMDTNKILPGQRAILKFIVTANENINLQMPEFADSLSDGIEIIGNAKLDTSKLSDNNKKIEQTLSITAFEPGLHYLAPQAFVVLLPGNTDTIFSSAGYLMVDTVAIDTTGTIRDIKNIEWVMPTPRDLLPLFIVMVALGLAGFLIVYFWPGKRNKLLNRQHQAVEPAYAIALRELDKLKAQKLWQQKLTKEYYSRLTEIIRTYIEKQFGIKAMEETTAEILSDIRKSGLEPMMNVPDLQNLLNLADLVKFARGEAQPEENIEHLERAYSFVKSSRQAIMESAIKNTTEDAGENLADSFTLAAKIKNVRGLSDKQIFSVLENGGRLVKYQYVLSIIVMTFSFTSKAYLMRAGEKGLKQSVVFIIITLFFGWWGIPWGPVRSVVALKNNFAGGKIVELE
ncbi:MAG: hypothetical protein JXB34_11445 [Bacteroidales bacterium]|nr:hypothetical protein [Bacteroidales bacterium]